MFGSTSMKINEKIGGKMSKKMINVERQLITQFPLKITMQMPLIDFNCDKFDYETCRRVILNIIELNSIKKI